MLLLKKHLVKLVREGKKRQTLRFWTRPIVSEGQISYTPGLGRMLIKRIDLISDISELTDMDAREDGFRDLSELLAELQRIYPTIPPAGKRLYRIIFEWPVPESPEGAPSTRRRSGGHIKDAEARRRSRKRPFVSAKPAGRQPRRRLPDADAVDGRSGEADESQRSPTRPEMLQVRDWILSQRGNQ